MINILRRDSSDAYGIRHFLADQEQEIKNISTHSLSPGSTVFVIHTSQTFMLDSNKDWIEQKSPCAGGGEGGGGNYPSPGEYDGGYIGPGRRR